VPNGELDDQGELDGPVPVGIVIAVPHAPATIAAARARPAPRNLALLDRIDDGTISLSRSLFANMPLPSVVWWPC
jgi:hypothetical protein